MAHTPWTPTNGKKPDLPGWVFVFVRYAGETREQAEAERDGYGQSVDSVINWNETIEYRRKHPESRGDGVMDRLKTQQAEARAALQLPEAAGWQPIDTVPKDGSTILAVGASGRVRPAYWATKHGPMGEIACLWTLELQEGTPTSISFLGATAWMALPDAVP